MGKVYKETCKANSFNLGVYFRYTKYSKEFSKEDKELLEQLKLKAWRDGNNEERFVYVICLENGFNGLKEDVEAAVNLSENGYEPATRNFAHFQEFGEYTYQDLHSALKKLEQYDDIEAKSSIEMMNIMLSDHPELPFLYNHKLNKAKSGHSDDPSKKYTKIAYMLIRNKEMIPNYKLAEKILNKAKHKSPLGIAINASINGDPRAGKPNATKAEKLFKEAMKQSSQTEIKELYADFLHSEDRDNEAEELGVDLNSAITTRPRKSKSARTNDNHAQLTDGKDLYHIGYIKNNDKRYLERAANFGFPLAQSEYAHLIIKEQKKKEYKKALTYLQKSAEEGIMTS